MTSKFQKLLHGDDEPKKKEEPKIGTAAAEEANAKIKKLASSLTEFAASLPPSIDSKAWFASLKAIEAEIEKKHEAKGIDLAAGTSTFSTALSEKEYREWREREEKRIKRERETEFEAIYSPFAPYPYGDPAKSEPYATIKIETAPGANPASEYANKMFEMENESKELRLMLREMHFALVANGIDCPFCGEHEVHDRGCPVGEAIAKPIP